MGRSVFSKGALVSKIHYKHIKSDFNLQSRDFSSIFKIHYVLWNMELTAAHKNIGKRVFKVDAAGRCIWFESSIVLGRPCTRIHFMGNRILK